MGLTFRDIKGSSLTIEEADGNFRYLTGSHEISGSLTISGSLLPSSISATLGSVDSPWKEIFVSGSTITFVGSSSAHTASISMTPDLLLSSSFTGSFSGDGSLLVNVQNSNVDGAPYQYGEAGTGPIEPVLGDNNSTSNYATIGGGQFNDILNVSSTTSSVDSFIGAGRRNKITGSVASFIGSGIDNKIAANNRQSVILGGGDNKIENDTDNQFLNGIDFTFPLVIDTTEIIVSSGSRGYNTIIGGMQNVLTASVGTFINGHANQVCGYWHSTVNGFANILRTCAYPTGSDLPGNSLEPGYRFRTIGARLTGYNNCIISTNCYLMGNDKILNSQQSKIEDGGNVTIKNSFNSKICTTLPYNWPGSGSNMDGSVIDGGFNNKIQTFYLGAYQSSYGISEQFSNNFIHNSIGGSIVNGRFSYINSSINSRISRSDNVRIFGGNTHKIFDNRGSTIVGGVRNCIKGANNFSTTANYVISYDTSCWGGYSNSIFGGTINLIETQCGNTNTIIGGQRQSIYGSRTFISLIASGICNQISGSSYSTIINGSRNCIIGVNSWYGSAALGVNPLTGSYSNILGGYRNAIFVKDRGGYSNIIAGQYNQITGSFNSTIIGGEANNMSHDRSYIIGSNISSSYNCTTHVNNIFISGGLRDSSGDLGSSTQILSSTGTGTNWISLGAATNTTYILEVASGLGDDNAIITLSGSDETEDNVNIIGGTGIDVSVSGDDITITNDYALNLVAGPGVVINENGDNTEISASVNPDNTGSFYYSSSVVLNTITFFQGDGTTETVTVDTGSGGGGGGDDFHHVYQSGSTGNNIKAILGSHINSGSYATIGGGSNNKIHTNGGNSFIGAGTSNITTGSNSFIGAGYNNCINSCGRCSAIVGGHDNNVFDDDSFIGGGHGNEVATSGNGQGWMTIGGGQFNCTGCGGAAVVGGAQNDALGCLSFIGGGFCNHANACYGVIGGGRENNISSLVCRASILGGASNTVSGSFSTILGGSTNTVKGRLGNITNGYLNNICGESCYNFIGNGCSNEMDTKASSSFIGGGERNCINAIGSFIGAGSDNQIEHANPNFTASNSVIVGGSGNCVANSGIIVGGSDNTISSGGNDGFIGGGCNNTVNCVYAAILAGDSNQIVTGGISSVIVAGSSNKITDVNSFIGAGTKNTGSGDRSVIVGGQCNSVSGNTNTDSSILGGCGNCIIESSFSNIGGGTKNLIYATGSKNSIVGGICNKISSSKEFEPNASAILGGEQNLLSHPYSFIMGVNIESDAPQTTFVNNFHATGSEGSENVVTFANLPTSDPENVGQLFVTQSDASGNLNGQYVLLVSQG